MIPPAIELLEPERPEVEFPSFPTVFLNFLLAAIVFVSLKTSRSSLRLFEFVDDENSGCCSNVEVPGVSIEAAAIAAMCSIIIPLDDGEDDDDDASLLLVLFEDRFNGVETFLLPPLDDFEL